MGDRGNILIDGVWLYTHWSGSELKEILRDALKRGKDRWDDSQYLARIIFSEMIKDDVLGTTDYGISCKMWDNEHNILEVDVTNQKIVEYEEDERKLGKVINEWTFKQFVEVV